jgi:hypothetical protein
MISSNNSLKLKDVLLPIGDRYLDSLSTEDLVGISRGLFKLVDMCDCVHTFLGDDYIRNKCHQFSPRYSVHADQCTCCKTQLLTYYLSRCMESLTKDGRLPEFEEGHLSRGRIQNRAYGFVKENWKIRFRILRHFYAWIDPGNMELKVQKWEFDLKELTLKMC